MTEADEVAATMVNVAWERGAAYWSMDSFRALVKEYMPDESVSVRDEVALSLFRDIAIRCLKERT